MLKNCFGVQEMQPTRAGSENLVLNFSPVQFDDTEITVGQLPYGVDGQQELERLRRDHNGTHVFRREGPDSILAVSVAKNASVIGETQDNPAKGTSWVDRGVGPERTTDLPCGHGTDGLELRANEVHRA
jgi:hypothetical protein